MVSVKTELSTCLPGCHFTSINTAKVLIFASHDYQTSKQVNPFQERGAARILKTHRTPHIKQQLAQIQVNFHDLQILPEHLRIKEQTHLL